MPLESPFYILDALQARAPHPEYTEKLMLFGQFIGVWAMDVKFYDENEQCFFHGPGEWAFSWILDGRAIQDTLSYRDAASGERRTGTTLRYYNAKQDMWQLLWLGAVSGIFLPLIGKAHGDDIWIEGQEAPHLSNRWIFTEISENRFHWIGLISEDDGATWRMEQEMWGERQKSGSVRN